MLTDDAVARRNSIKRKHLVSSLITGLIIGAIAGAPIGWFAHRFYFQQRFSQYLLCREQNRDQSAAVVESRCGIAF